MRQICNLVYSVLTEGMTAAQKAEIDVLLSGPEDREEMIAKQNAIAMKAIGGVGMLVPPPPKKAGP